MNGPVLFILARIQCPSELSVLVQMLPILCQYSLASRSNGSHSSSNSPPRCRLLLPANIKLYLTDAHALTILQSCLDT